MFVGNSDITHCITYKHKHTHTHSCVDKVLAQALSLIQGCPCGTTAVPPPTTAATNSDSTKYTHKDTHTHPPPPQNTGCPACLHSFNCSDYNQLLDKDATILILQKLIEKRKRQADAYTQQLALEAAVVAGAFDVGGGGGEGCW